MITLFHAPQSRSSRIVWLLEELGQPYEIRPVSIFRPMNGTGTPDAANPHPDKRVPALEHDGQLLAESIAIFLYLAETFPDAGLAPRAGEAGRGDWLTWVSWYAAEMEPAMIAAMDGGASASPQRQRNQDAVVARLRNALARAPYLLGDTFSSADLLVSSALRFGRGVFPFDEAIDAYVERCMARPAAVRAAGMDDATGMQRAA